jgi:pyruvate,water dikinase
MTALDERDPIRGDSEPGRCWTLANVNEATPLTLTALEWSLWGTAVELGALGSWYDFGFIARDDVRESADPNQRVTSCFYGRQAMNIDRTRLIMAQIPGTDADDFERDILGWVRPDAVPAPNTLRRVPVIAAKAPLVLARQTRAIAALHADQTAWWRDHVLRGGPAEDPWALLDDATARFGHAMRVHVRSRTLLQGFQSAVADVCAKAGCPELSATLLSGYGGVIETSIADDVWLLSRGRVGRDDVVRAHGYHGPNEGNPRARVWREDPDMIDALAKAAAARSDDERPRLREARAVRAREAAEAELLARVPAAKRPLTRALLRAAGSQVRNLGLGKAAFLTAVDGCRAAVRRIGDSLAAEGRLADPDDVFHLTPTELRGPGTGWADLVTSRRARHAEYDRLTLPVVFVGMPEPVSAEAPADGPVTGVCGAPGTVEGTARVVLDPLDAEPLEPGDILVCRLTDPSWAALFSMADGLVIDVGGPASHGAIVARELGVPCVIGTDDGTRRIRTGDRLRVDGDAGTVTVL